MKKNPLQKVFKAPLTIRLAQSFATCGGVGYIPVAPGTCGACLALLLWELAAKNWTLLASCGAFILFLLVGSVAVDILLRQTVEQDPSYVVIDEFLGQYLALLLVPAGFYSHIVTFLLFRFFDIKKIGPTKWLDDLSQESHTLGMRSTLCVIGDDLFAGICAATVTKLLAHFHAI